MSSICSQAGDNDWRRGLPELTDGSLVLRELRVSDAPALLMELNRARVWRHIPPSPSTVQGFERFIRWTHRQRRRGLHACYGIVPAGAAEPVGIIQFWPIDVNSAVAEWGFVVGEAFWGTGLFVEAASLFLDAAFSTFGVVRLEARAVSSNGRANGALRKMGARSEGVLRGGIRIGTRLQDHVMWALLAPEWAVRRGYVRRAV